MTTKAAFEAKATELGLPIERSAVRADWYAYSETNIAWQCWQAAEAAERERMRALIADDASAATYQTMGQYRAALLRALKA